MYPKDYRLIVSLKFNPNTLKKVSEEEKLLLTRFKMIELENDENEEENNKEEPNEVTKIIKSIDTSKAITDNKPFIRKKSNNTKERKSVKLPKLDNNKEKKSITNNKSINMKEESKNQNNSTSILQILKPAAIKETSNERDKKEESTLSTSNSLPPTIQPIQRVSTIKKDEQKEESKKREETAKSNNSESILLRKSTPYEDTVSFETYQRIQNEIPIKRTNSPILKKTVEFEDTNDMIIEEDTSNDETKKMNFENNTLDDIIIHEKKREHKHKSEHQHKREHNKDHLKEHKHCKEHHHKKRIENKKKEGTKPKKCTTAEKIYNEIETKKYRINLFDGF